MVEDEPYDLMPHREITELKRQLQELKTNPEKSSSHQLISSMDSLTKGMDTMLRLFTQAAEELKLDEKGGTHADHKSINGKLDQIIEQNRAIAEGMVAISDMINDIGEKQKEKPKPVPAKPIPQPPTQISPSFDQKIQQPPSFDQSLSQPPQDQGPVPMPAMSFSDLEEPKKKGLFGRLKK